MCGILVISSSKIQKVGGGGGLVVRWDGGMLALLDGDCLHGYKKWKNDRQQLPYAEWIQWKRGISYCRNALECWM